MINSQIQSRQREIPQHIKGSYYQEPMFRLQERVGRHHGTLSSGTEEIRPR